MKAKDVQNGEKGKETKQVTSWIFLVLDLYICTVSTLKHAVTKRNKISSIYIYHLNLNKYNSIVLVRLPLVHRERRIQFKSSDHKYSVQKSDSVYSRTVQRQTLVLFGVKKSMHSFQNDTNTNTEKHQADAMCILGAFDDSMLHFFWSLGFT